MAIETLETSEHTEARKIFSKSFLFQFYTKSEFFVNTHDPLFVNKSLHFACYVTWHNQRGSMWLFVGYYYVAGSQNEKIILRSSKYSIKLLAKLQKCKMDSSPNNLDL